MSAVYQIDLPESSFSPLDRKIWDTFSGEPLHSFPHNHIVRTVAISRTSSHILTGGQEKKVRIFDLARPDAEADLLGDSGTTPHDKTVKSVVWVGEHTGVSAGEDGIIKCAFLRTFTHFVFIGPQVVGSTDSQAYDLACFPKSNHVYGTLSTDKAACRYVGRNCGVYTCLAKHSPNSQSEPAVFALIRFRSSHPARSFCHRESRG